MTDGVSTPAPARRCVIERLLAIVRAQRWMWAEAGCVWARRPLPSVRYARTLGDGQRFAQQRGSWMSVLVPMVVFSQFVDLLIAQGVIHVAAAPAHRAPLHALLLGLSLWSLAWAVALRSATRHVDHVLGPHALTLASGFKHVCRLPLAAIADVHRIDHRGSVGGKDWFERFGLQRNEVAVLTALDPPTLLIALKDDARGAWRTCHGERRPLARWVAVHVDQPEAMRGAVLAETASSTSSAALQA